MAGINLKEIIKNGLVGGFAFWAFGAFIADIVGITVNVQPTGLMTLFITGAIFNMVLEPIGANIFKNVKI